MPGAQELIRDRAIHGDSPRTGAPLPPVPVTSPDELAAAVERARRAQVTWSALAPAERSRRLREVRAALFARAEAMVATMTLEQGKSPAESYTSEIVPSGDLVAFWAREAPRLLAPERRRLNPINFPRKTGELTLVPRGVIALITPWNYPLAIPLRTLVPALAAGNAVVFKPSEYAPRIGRELAALFDQLGVPDVVTTVFGGAEVGAALTQAAVDHVVFTGSVAAGRAVARACAERLVRCSLELGGKDAAIVLGDADLARTVEGVVWGAFANAGQNCAAIERVYVVASVAEAFVDRVVTRTRALRVGGPGMESWDVGPLVRPAGLATVAQRVEDAVKSGARVLVGGHATGWGRHYEPTVIVGVDDDMALLRDETFGPVLPIVVVADADEAIARANRSSFGLTASLWTSDLERARALAPRLRAGVVTINNHAFTAALPHAPWHGTGDSGGGTTGSRYAFYELCEPRFTLVDKSRARELWWFPHTPRLAGIARALVTLAGRGGHKLRALLSLLRLFPRRWQG
jgi:acyl-CoA reductase-like NAD-dependent aldehyde dehydrogenase